MLSTLWTVLSAASDFFVFLVEVFVFICISSTYLGRGGYEFTFRIGGWQRSYRGGTFLPSVKRRTRKPKVAV
jgi:hypothetical protein